MLIFNRDWRQSLANPRYRI